MYSLLTFILFFKSYSLDNLIFVLFRVSNSLLNFSFITLLLSKSTFKFLISFKSNSFELFNFNSSSFKDIILLCSFTSSTSYFFLSNIMFFSPLSFSTLLVILTISFCFAYISSFNLDNSNFFFAKSASNALLEVDNSIISLLRASILTFEVLYVSFILSKSLTIKDISTSSNSLLIFKYFSAFSLCSFKGTTCNSNSFIMSFILSILSCVLSNFLVASSFLFLYFKTPAALSNIVLLSSAFVLMILEISPCDIIENDSFALPLSISNSAISFNLTFSLFI